MADFNQHSSGSETNSQDYNNVAKVLQLSRKEYFLISLYLVLSLHFYGLENCNRLGLVGDYCRDCYVGIVGIGFLSGKLIKITTSVKLFGPNLYRRCWFVTR